MAENGNGGISSLISKLSPTTLALVGNLVLLGVLWGNMQSRVDDLKEKDIELRQEFVRISVKLDLHEKALNDDRYNLSNRLVEVETNTKFISKTLEEVKLLLRK
jgi:DNA transposition AAA+ family ATPase